MARRTQQFTGGTEFTGTQYTQALATRTVAMKGFAEGTVDAATKNAARAEVRRMRKAINATELSVPEWRQAEAEREAAQKASRKRSRTPVQA